MEPALVGEIGREAIYVLIYMSAPVLLVSLVVGLSISLLQALTQIQETTLTFVPKIIAIYLVMLLAAPFMFGKLKVFVDLIMQHIIN